VKVLFQGEAAKTILEYNFHKSQEMNVKKNGTLVTWQLSYLGEFASWLMQWCGSFKILEPNELKEELDRRIKGYADQH
jgi:predicted DNA-binding transcriptional regulator YafY